VRAHVLPKATVSRYWEPRLASFVVQVLPGELHVTTEDVVITTVLGSCVSACVRDRTRGIGGINHFMLPYALRGDDAASARYGVYALECLVNRVLGSTGRRADLEAKVFGSGQVISAGSDVGRHNIKLVREFLASEGIAIASADVGHKLARRIRYWPRSGRVQVQRIPMAHAREVVATEETAAHSIAGAPGSVELF
jgi:chemotaxis protein CheD